MVSIFPWALMANPAIPAPSLIAVPEILPTVVAELMVVVPLD